MYYNNYYRDDISLILEEFRMSVVGLFNNVFAFLDKL